MDKVYIIFEVDLNTNRRTVHAVFANKEKAKSEVDQLTRSNIENEDVDFVLQSFDLMD